MNILKEFHSLGCRIEHIDQSLMTANLELFTCIFIHKSRSIQRYLLYLCGKWDGSHNSSTAFLYGNDDFFDRFIDDLMLEGLDNNTDLLDSSLLRGHRRKGKDVNV